MATSWRMAKAERFLEAARDAFEQEHWETVASRAYYAAYHLAAAALETRGGISRRPWRAEQLMRDLRERFTNRGYLLSSRDAFSFRELVGERYAADYSNESFNRKRATRVLAVAEKLCSRLETVVRDA